MSGHVNQPVWSYRVLRQVYEVKGEGPGVVVEYGVFEVYFDEQGAPVGYCDPHVLGDSEDELRSVLGTMLDALDEPVLEASDFKGEQVRTAMGGPKPIIAPQDPKSRT